MVRQGLFEFLALGVRVGGKVYALHGRPDARRRADGADAGAEVQGPARGPTPERAVRRVLCRRGPDVETARRRRDQAWEHQPGGSSWPMKALAKHRVFRGNPMVRRRISEGRKLQIARCATAPAYRDESPNQRWEAHEPADTARPTIRRGTSGRSVPIR